MASRIISGENLGEQICNALGISTHLLRSVYISIELDDVVIITAEYLMDEEQADKLVGTLQKYSNGTDENKDTTDGETLLHFGK